MASARPYRARPEEDQDLKVEVLLRSHADPYIIASHLTRGLLIFHREVVQQSNSSTCR